MRYETNYLQHHGVRGMKWGVRNYQNKDGSYTALGKSRRKSSKTSVKKASKKTPEQKAAQRAKTANRIAIGMQVSAGLLAGYATYKYSTRIGDRILKGSSSSVSYSTYDRAKVDSLMKSLDSNISWADASIAANVAKRNRHPGSTTTTNKSWADYAWDEVLKNP